MKTRNGKIARLPKPIRDQLNHRLENGEPGTSLVAWLNQLPEVQKIITEQFDGKSIRPQNLSEWRKGGYIDWIRHQLLREQTRWTAEQAAELGLDAAGATISIAEDIATVMSAELAIHVQALGDIKNPTQRFNQFRRLSLELSRLRRDDHRTIRQLLRRKKQQSTPEPIEEKPAQPHQTTEPSSILDPQPSPLPSAGGASSPSAEALCEVGSSASRAPHETNVPNPTQLATLAEASAESASVPANNSSTPKLSNSQTPPTPLPLPETISTPPAPNPEPPVANETASPTSSFCIQPSSFPKNALPAIPTPQPSAPIRINPSNNYYDPRPPRRGRRFVCIEG